MKWKKIEGHVELVTTEDELDIIFRCLNEICNGVRMIDTEFETRVGAERKIVRALLQELIDIK